MANWNTGHNHFPADVGVQCGMKAQQSVAKGSNLDTAITFSKAFHDVPNVVVCPYLGNFSNCAVGVIATSTTGFTCRIFNPSGSTVNVGFQWIAVGTPK